MECTSVWSPSLPFVSRGRLGAAVRPAGGLAEEDVRIARDRDRGAEARGVLLFLGFLRMPKPCRWCGRLKMCAQGMGAGSVGGPGELSSNRRPVHHDGAN